MSEAALRVLVVDDEEPARHRLIELLRPLAGVEVVGEAEDGEQAAEKILQLKPDLVLLDIQMPGCSGLEVAASLPSPGPRIVFCTAYDQYAVDAFELNAVDYLLKPVTRARLQKTIDRVRGFEGTEAEDPVARASQATSSYPSRFLAKHGTRYTVVPQKSVLYFDSEEGLTRVHTRERHYIMQPSLADLERRLDPQAFLRISRAAIVNLDAVRELKPLPGGTGEVTLVSGARLEVSRRRLRPLTERLEG